MVNAMPLSRRLLVDWLGLSDLYGRRLAFRFAWQVDVMPGRSTLNLVLGANIIGPPGRLHKQDHSQSLREHCLR
jgi:hypothetical protein